MGKGGGKKWGAEPRLKTGGERDLKRWQGGAKEREEKVKRQQSYSKNKAKEIFLSNAHTADEKTKFVPSHLLLSKRSLCASMPACRFSEQSMVEKD